MQQPNVVFRSLSGLQDYETIWRHMRDFTHARTETNPGVDQVWLLEHAPVYTQGQAGKAEHLLANPLALPVIQSDRGGQITYHGPGQLMVYLLLTLKNYGFHAKSYVHFLEQTLIALLKRYDIQGFTQADAPGVYVQLPNEAGLQKIASIGIRIRKGFSYHGLCLNVSADLSPFQHINPCGYKGLGMAQLHDFDHAKAFSLQQVRDELTDYLKTTLEVRKDV